VDAATPAAASVGLARRLAAGAWHVPAGAFFLVRHPRLWLPAALPGLVSVALVGLGLFGGGSAARAAEGHLIPADGRVAPWWGVLLTVSLWFGALAAGALAGLALALLLMSPLLDLLSHRVEALLGARSASRGWRWELSQSLRSSLYLLGAAALAFLLGLFPLLGPAFGAACGALALAFQQSDGTLVRRGLDFEARRAWHRRYRPEALGFGLAGVVVLLVPCSGLLLAPVLAPALTVGATRLVLELEADAA
jgi:CysZ protein